MKWIRYYFRANPKDSRPVKFPPPGPCWETGYGDDFSTCVAYLPVGVKLTDYWPEAWNVSAEERESIEFNSRFPRPEWWNEESTQ